MYDKILKVYEQKTKILKVIDKKQLYQGSFLFCVFFIREI